MLHPAVRDQTNETFLKSFKWKKKICSSTVKGQKSLRVTAGSMTKRQPGECEFPHSRYKRLLAANQGIFGQPPLLKPHLLPNLHWNKSLMWDAAYHKTHSRLFLWTLCYKDTSFERISSIHKRKRNRGAEVIRSTPHKCDPTGEHIQDSSQVQRPAGRAQLGAIIGKP